MKKTFINREQIFMSNQQPAVVSDPGECSFDDPASSIPSQLAAILHFRFLPIFSMWADQINLALFQFLSEWITIVSTIGNQALGAGLRPARSIARHFDLGHHPVNKGYFVRGCRGNGASQRNTFAVDHHHPLRSFAPFGFSNPKAPFFAGAKLPSMKASSQSNKDFSSRSAKNLRQTSSQTPSSSHSRKRRQHVEGLGYLLGRSFQRAPVRRIQRIPSNTSRLSAWGRPTRPFRCFGSKGSIRFHCSSFINRACSAIGSPPIAYYTKIQQKSRLATACLYYILCSPFRMVAIS